jgi:hypothetical protein
MDEPFTGCKYKTDVTMTITPNSSNYTQNNFFVTHKQGGDGWR